jgi:butyrate kinase
MAKNTYVIPGEKELEALAEGVILGIENKVSIRDSDSDIRKIQ